MSSTKAPAQPRPAPAKASDPNTSVEPLRPRRGLFYVLLATFAVWIAILLAMYFTTL